MSRTVTTITKRGSGVASPKQSTQTITVQKRRKRRGNRKQRGNVIPSQTGPVLSGCALDYARCLANPFTGPIACVPTYPAMLTRRMRCYAKGVLQTGVNGDGYILVNPADGVANDRGSVATSSAATAVAVSATNIGTDPNIVQAATNSEYTAAQFGATPSTAKFRVVAFGVRTRYVGTQLNLGGQLIGLHEPDHNNLDNQTIGNWDAQTESRRLVPARQWATVLYKPVEQTDLEFGLDFPASLTADGSWFMGFMIKSAVAAQPFEWEAFGVYEIEGRNLRGKVPSHNDPIGHAAVHSVASTSTELYPTNKSDQEREQSFVSKALDYLGSGISHTSKLIEHVDAATDVVSRGNKALTRNHPGFWSKVGGWAARNALPLAEEALMLL